MLTVIGVICRDAVVVVLWARARFSLGDVRPIDAFDPRMDGLGVNVSERHWQRLLGS